MSVGDSDVIVRRGLEGYKGRRNDVISVGEDGEGSQLVVYFGGDVQDLEAVMAEHRDNSRYTQWSLENTARLLARTQASSHISPLSSHIDYGSSLQAEWNSLVAVVRPARIARSSISCYDNFVPSNDVGSPSHCDDHGALAHLRLLLHHLQSPLTGPVSLIGFSKGVVVLNQLLRELSCQART